MIKVLDERTERFIKFLNQRYPLKGEVKLTPLWNYDAMSSDGTGAEGFAVYLPEVKTIMLPMEIPESILELNDPELNDTFVISNLAHEYCHALQDERENYEFSEESENEANEFATKVVEGFLEEDFLEWAE